jgi:multidrug efflux pump subunit AcrA (membrane-fusion protein)
MNLKKWITAIVLVVVIAGGLVWFFGPGKASASVSDRDLITAQRVDFPVLVSASGTLEATKSVSISPPQVRNQRRFKLTRMVDEGTNVSEGDFLMEFDTSDIARSMRDETANFQRVQEDRQNKRANSDLNLKNQRLSLAQAKSDLQKLEVKMSSQVDLLSGIEVEKTRLQRDASRKNMEFMEKKIALMTKSSQLDLQISTSNEQHYRRRMEDLMDAMDSYTVRAPVSGVVIYKRDWNNEAKTVGSSVFGMDAVLEIPDLSTIRARVQVDEVDSGKIKVGQTSNITVDAVRGQTFSGKIVSIGTILKQASFDRPQKICDAYVELEGADMKQLRPGMSLKAQVLVGQYSKIVAIPLSSIQERDGRSFVQVWQPEKKAFSWREIELKTNDGVTAVVASGLNANEKIRIKPKA